MNDYSFNRTQDLTGPQLVARAEAMIPRLRERAAAADRDSVLAPETVRELRDAGFFRIMQPPRFGGYGLRPSVLWEVTRQLGRGCGSSAFIVSLLGVNSWIAGMFAPEAQAEVFGEDGDAVISMLSIGVRRRNEVQPVDGGYRVSGQWSYATGIDAADWAIVATRVPRGDDHEERLALVPVHDLAIEPGSWDVLGARGTGSRVVTLDDVFVPHHRTVVWTELQRGIYPGAPVHEGALYRLNLGSIFVLSSAAPVVAVASGLVDAFVAQIKGATGRRQAGQQWLQIELGNCASQVAMAHALLIRDADEVHEAAVAGTELEIEVQARHRADAAVISRTALAAAERLFCALGGSVLDPAHPATRAFRDIHVMATHWRVQPEPPCEVYGRILLGVD